MHNPRNNLQSMQIPSLISVEEERVCLPLFQVEGQTGFLAHPY